MIIKKVQLNNTSAMNMVDTKDDDTASVLAAYGIDIKEIEAGETARLEKEKKKLNTDYNGVSISLTSEDQAGLLAVKAGFELGMERTVFRFENGTKMEMTLENFPGIATFFVKERSKFFQE